MRRAASMAALLGLLAGGADAAEVKVLSAGAVEPGLHAVAEAFRAKTGDTVQVTFATAPAIRKRLAEGERIDVAIAPAASLDEGDAVRLDRASRVPAGKVGVGVAVREGAPVPDVASADALKRAIVEAESVVYNQASTGLYMEKLLERLGIADAVKAKATRPPDGAGVMEQLRRGKGREIGFGAITEILLFRDKGVRLVGPLPADVQNFTTYLASPSSAGPNPDGAKAFVAFLASEPARALMKQHGID